MQPERPRPITTTSPNTVSPTAKPQPRTGDRRTITVWIGNASFQALLV